MLERIRHEDAHDLLAGGGERLRGRRGREQLILARHARSVEAGIGPGPHRAPCRVPLTHGSFAICRSARPGPALRRAAAGGRVARASTRPGRLFAGGRRAHCAERRRPAPRVRPAGEWLLARACRTHPRLSTACVSAPAGRSRSGAASLFMLGICKSRVVPRASGRCDRDSARERCRRRGARRARRRVYSVANVNRGLARRIDELPALWVEGEIGDLRYHANRGVTFLTLRDPDEGATLLGDDGPLAVRAHRPAAGRGPARPGARQGRRSTTSARSCRCAPIASSPPATARCSRASRRRGAGSMPTGSSRPAARARRRSGRAASA